MTTQKQEEVSHVEADVLVENCGSVAMFTPMTPAARQWVEENVNIEPWQRMGDVHRLRTPLPTATH